MTKDYIETRDENGQIRKKRTSKPELEAVETKKAFTKSRAYQIIIFEDDDGTVYAVDDGDVIAQNDSDGAPVVEQAVENNPSKAFWVNGDVRVEKTIDVDLGGAAGLVFHMGGRFQPATGLTYVMKVVNGVDADIRYAVGPGDGANYTYAQDFAHNVAGLDTALYIRGVNNADIHFRGDFDGRGLEVEEQQTGEEGSAEYTVGSFNADNIGQSMFIKMGSGFGTIDNTFVGENDGAYINTADVNIAFYENLYTGGSNPVTIDNSASVHIEHLAVGPTVDPLVHLTNSHGLVIDNIYAYGDQNAVDGVLVEDCGQVRGGIRTSQCGGYGLVCDGVRNGSRIWHMSRVDRRSLHLTAEADECRELTVIEDTLQADERAVHITEGANGAVDRCSIGGYLREANWSQTAGESTVHVDTANHSVDFREATFEGAHPDYHLDAPADNEIRFIGCNTKGEPNTAKFKNFPIEVQHDRNYTVRDSGRVSDAVLIGSDGSTGEHHVTVSPSINRELDPRHVTNVSLSTPTTNNYDAYIRDIQAFGSDGEFLVKVMVESLSGSTGDTVDLSWSVNASLR